MASKKQEPDDYFKTARTTSSKKKPTASNRAFFSSSTPKHSRQGKVHKQNNPSFTIAKEINSRIIASGKNHDWKGILEIYQKEMVHFSFMNYATAMSQLGRIRSLHRADARLEELMIDIAMQLQSPGNGSWGAQGMANVLHAVAKMGLRSNGATQCVDSILGEENIQVILENGTPQNIANTAWACATLDVQCPTLFQRIEANASKLVENGTPQNIANTAWACATLGVPSPTLFKLIDANASYIVNNGKPQEVANTAWAFATLGIACPTLFNAMVSQMLTKVEFGNVQNISMLCYSFAILDLAKDYESMFRILWGSAIKINPSELSVESCLQLLQTFVMVSQMLDIPPPNDDIQKLLVWLDKAPIESRSQREMSQLLVKLGFPHEVEVSPFQDQAFAVPSSLLAIDAACRERMIAIEFDGPSHFLKDITKTGKVSEGVLVENGPTKAKRRLLERLGWTVINIRYWEWDSARTESEKMKLLSGKLSAA